MNSDNSFWMLTFVKCNTRSMHKIKMINFTPQKCELLQSACLYVCLSVHTSQTWRNFLFLFTVTVAVARFSLVAMQYVIYFRFVDNVMFFTQWPSVQAGYVRRMLGVGLRKTTQPSTHSMLLVGSVWSIHTVKWCHRIYGHRNHRHFANIVLHHVWS